MIRDTNDSVGTLQIFITIINIGHKTIENAKLMNNCWSSSNASHLQFHISRFLRSIIGRIFSEHSEMFRKVFVIIRLFLKFPAYDFDSKY